MFFWAPWQRQYMLKLINQPVDQAAIKWPQLPPFNHAKQGCFYFTHYWPLIRGGHAQILVHNALQVAAVWSSIVGAPTRNVGGPINPLELWSPILPSLKLSLKPTSAPFGLASTCNNTSCPVAQRTSEDNYSTTCCFVHTLYNPLWIHARCFLHILNIPILALS